VKLFCIADEETVRGFRLAGVEGEAVQTPTEAKEALQRASARTDLGVLILTQQVAVGIRELVATFHEERDCPLLVEIPGPEGPLPEWESLRQLVHSAIGIRLEPENGA
jgi:vacuolar-type H+-ATPase subunit F/Vma7